MKLLAGTSKGIFPIGASNGGATWALGLPGGNPAIHMMAAHPAKAGVLFATTGYGRLAGVAEMIEGDDEIPSYPACGLTVPEVDPATLPEANRRRVEVFKRMRKIMEDTR